ncbi:MAG: DEAD/DEAH box helicase family protein [Armatimonadetes bacterium]|nr:DEAD/DEAH box helicase family protein [Armatimonadota bacterium]
MSEKLPTLIDNTPDRTALDALKALLPSSKKWDIATGFFEIGAFDLLEGLWQPLEKIRILLGDETTKRTRQALVGSLREQSDESIEAAKERDDSLTGLQAVRAALQSKRIEARVYTRAKFHAKAHRLETHPPTPVNYGLIGSSNFTQPGLTRNLELNLFTTDASQLNALKEWYDGVWAEAEEVQADLLSVLEPHLRLYSPFEVYARALHAYLSGREISADAWERNQSVIYKILSKYQRDGYHQALAIAERWGGALISDGVGLGKTFIGLMLIERHLHLGHKVVVVVPKSTRESVWESNLRRYLATHRRRVFEQSLVVYNHTDFGRPETLGEAVQELREVADVVVIDEAHHFRTSSANRYELMSSLLKGRPKKLYMLTATPINNSLLDLYNLLNLFVQDRQAHFASIRIHNLRRYFTDLEKGFQAGAEGDASQMTLLGLDEAADLAQKRDLIRSDEFLKHVVIQRSRSYVADSEQGLVGAPVFPQRDPPHVVEYSLKEVYEGIYDTISFAFGKPKMKDKGKEEKFEPALRLSVYNPERFRLAPKDPNQNRKELQVIGLIRTSLLKQLESSYQAFEGSMERLLLKMKLVLEANYAPGWQKWEADHASLWSDLLNKVEERTRDADDPDNDEEENDPPDVPAWDVKEFDVETMVGELVEDMDLLAELLKGVYSNLSPDKDDKLQKLLGKLAEDPLLFGRKIVLFTEFKDTARYLFRQLRERLGVEGIEQLDSGRHNKGDARERIIKRFAPVYNCDESDRQQYQADPIRVLVSTDVLSEGLNLQDSARLINYDIHWNPVRLMQRIGRVDRRLDLAKEALLGRDPDSLRVHFYNFLPPQELDDLLGLFERVSGKVLRINKTLGLEAPLLRPDDPVEALRNFNHQYEQAHSAEERMLLALEAIEREHPELYSQLQRMPRRLFSGKKNKKPPRGLFCCYRLPTIKEGVPGEVVWRFIAHDGRVAEGLEEIHETIQCLPDTPRVTTASGDQLKEWREALRSRCIAPRLRDLQAPMGAKEQLVCWMEVS